MNEWLNGCTGHRLMSGKYRLYKEIGHNII